MPSITAERLYDAFGLTPPKEQGAQAQEPAAPAAEETTAPTDQGAQVQEPAVPAAVVTEPAPERDLQEPEENPNTSAGEGKPDSEELTLEQRRANAARRRQQEQQAAIDQAVAAALQEEQKKTAAALEEVFAKAGLRNSFTGQDIKTIDELNAWHKQFVASQLQSDLRAGKLTPEAISALIEQHPAIQQAQALIDQNAEAQRQQAQAADKARIDNEIAEIGKLDPSIKGVTDLLSMPKAAEFKAYVDKGYSFLDAFKLTNMEAISTAKAERAKQEALNNSRGKNHMQATGNSGGAGAAPVPSGQLEMFRRMNPGKSDAEIQKFYNNYVKRQGG